MKTSPIPKAKVYKYYTDPGHGWLAVKKQELIDLGIADNISPYSYTKGQTVYLEEDRDMFLFVQAWKVKYHSFAFLMDHKYRDDLKIRSYERYDYRENT